MILKGIGVVAGAAHRIESIMNLENGIAFVESRDLNLRTYFDLAEEKPIKFTTFQRMLVKILKRARQVELRF